MGRTWQYQLDRRRPARGAGRLALVLILASWAPVAGCSLDWSANAVSQAASSSDGGVNVQVDGALPQDRDSAIPSSPAQDAMSGVGGAAGSNACSACAAGFACPAVGSECVDVDECNDVERDVCGGNATCHNEPGGHRCECVAGFALDAAGCTDIDECQQPDSGGCSPDASCRNVPGSRVCTCDPGFEDPTGDGTQCVSKCDLAGCDANALCTVRGEQAECECTSPYVGNGMSCTFDAECALLGCDVHAECEVTGGDSRECSCRAGYEGSGTSCTNLDECAAAPSLCGSNARCIDTDGSYRCECNAGYAPVAGVCTNVDDCASQPCQHGGSCTDRVAGFTCSCTGTGYSGTQCQTNVDDCASHPCQNGGRCIDAVLDFTCDCAGTGHSGDLCQSIMGTCCPNGDCLCHGPNPTALTSSMGPYTTASYTISGAGCVHYPTDAEPPFAAVVIADGFMGTGGCGPGQVDRWGPFYASHGIVVMIVDTSGGDQPARRGVALLQGIAAFKAENTSGSSPLSGKLAGRYGTSGFSMGGGGSTYAARDDSTLLTNVAIMPWSPLTSGVGVPTLIICGSSDTLANCDAYGTPAYEGIAASVPKMRVLVSSGHAGQPSAGGGAVGQYGLAFQKVFLEGDQRWRPLLVAAPSDATNIQ